MVEQAADADSQQEVNEQQPQIARLSGEPAGGLAKVGSQLGKQHLTTARQNLLPEAVELVAHQRDLLQPEQLRRRRLADIGAQLDQHGRFLRHIGQRHKERDNEHQQQHQRHEEGRQRPFAPQHPLHHQHQRPGGDGDHGGPHQRGQEGLQHQETGDNQDAEKQHPQGYLGQIHFFHVHRVSLSGHPPLGLESCFKRDSIHQRPALNQSPSPKKSTN